MVEMVGSSMRLSYYLMEEAKKDSNDNAEGDSAVIKIGDIKMYHKTCIIKEIEDAVTCQLCYQIFENENNVMCPS
jgi:hypothetical protein